MKPASVIILTHKENGEVKLPHLEWLRCSNPDVRIHVVVGDDSPLGKRDNWKNGDRPLRDWWRERRGEVVGEVVVVLEWDTLVTTALPELPNGTDLAGAAVYHSPESPDRPKRLPMRHPAWTSDNWYWWVELPLLGLNYGDAAIGLVSFGCMVMRREVLDSVADPKWDAVYARSIQNELRFPTVAQLSGHVVKEIDLPFVKFNDVRVTDTPGVYHSVDHPLPLPTKILIDGGHHFGEGLNLLDRRLRCLNSTEWRIYAFEPNPEISMGNALGNVDYRTQAVWVADGELPFKQHACRRYGTLTGVGSCLDVFSNGGHPVVLDAVPTIDFARFLRELPPHEKLVVKLDIEMAEFEVLRHLLREGVAGMIDELYVETHERFLPGENWVSVIELFGELRAVGVEVKVWY